MLKAELADDTPQLGEISEESQSIRNVEGIDVYMKKILER